MAEAQQQQQTTELPAVDPAVAKLQADIKKKDRDIEALRKLVMVQQPQPQQQPQQQQQQPVDMPALNKQFFNDPVVMATNIADAVSQRRAQEVVTQMVGGGLETMQQTARNLARQGKEELFDKYAGDIEQQVALLAPQYRTNATVWATAFQNVLGKNIDEIVEMKKHKAEENKSPALHITKEGGPQSGRATAPQQTQTVPLNDDEKYIAKRLGVTEADYSKSKASMTVVGQRAIIGEKKGLSLWDTEITTDSREGRRKRLEQRKSAAAAHK